MNTAIEDNQGSIHPPLPLTCPLLRIFVLHVKCFKAMITTFLAFLVNISITASSVEALPGSGTAKCIMWLAPHSHKIMHAYIAIHYYAGIMLDAFAHLLC